MDHKTVEEFILSFPSSKLDYPFGKEVAVYKVFVDDTASASHFDIAPGGREDQTEPYKNTVMENPEQDNVAIYKEQQQVASSARKQAAAVRGDWKMFALIQERSDPLRISLKCDPQLAILLREKYETVMPGYHLNKKHWNTIVLTGQLSWDEVKGFIRLSYNLAAS